MISYNPPKPSHRLSQKGIKPDLRRSSSAIAVLIWAFRTENVRAALMNAGDDMSRGSMSCLADLIDRVASDRRGCIAGHIEAHEDAVAVAMLANRVLPPASWLRIITAVEKGELPQWFVPPEPRRFVPRMKDTPSGPVMDLVYPVNGRKVPYLCVLDVVGRTDAEHDALVKAAVDAWFDLVRLLELIASLPLTRFRVLDLGVERFPWDKAQQIAS